MTADDQAEDERRLTELLSWLRLISAPNRSGEVTIGREDAVVLLEEYERRGTEIEAFRYQVHEVMEALNAEGDDPVSAASFTRQAADAFAARLAHAEHVRDVAIAQAGQVRAERTNLWKILGRPDGNGTSVELCDAVADERDARRRFQQDAAEREARLAAVRALADEAEQRASEMVGIFSGKKGAVVPAWVARVRAALNTPADLPAEPSKEDLPPGTHEEFGLRFPDGVVRYIGRDSAEQLAAHPEWGATLVRRTNVVVKWSEDAPLDGPAESPAACTCAGSWDSECPLHRSETAEQTEARLAVGPAEAPVSESPSHSDTVSVPPKDPQTCSKCGTTGCAEDAASGWYDAGTAEAAEPALDRHEKSVVYQLRLNEPELVMLESAAKARGVLMGRFIKQAALTAAVSGSGAVSTRTPDPRAVDLSRCPEPPTDEGSAEAAESAPKYASTADDIARVEAMIAAAPPDYPGIPGLRKHLDELRDRAANELRASGPAEPGPGWDIAVAAAEQAVTDYARRHDWDLHHGDRFDLAHDVCCALYQERCLSEVWPAHGPAEEAEPARVQLDDLFVENAEARDAVGPCRADEGNTGIDCMIEYANHPLPHRGWWRYEHDPIGESGIYIEWPIPDRPGSATTTPDPAALAAAARDLLDCLEQADVDDRFNPPTVEQLRHYMTRLAALAGSDTPAEENDHV